MNQYLDLLKDIKEKANEKSDRTGVGTVSVFGRQFRCNLEDGFPLLTTKKLFIKGIIHELLWFLQGSTNIEYLVKNGVMIWNEWPYKAYLQKTSRLLPPTGSIEWHEGMGRFVEQIKSDPEFARNYGELGPVYGYQWRSCPAPDGRKIDQITNVIDQIKRNPDSRRLI